MPTMNRVEPLGQVRTKIVATIGPASRSPEVLRQLVEAGVDLFRLNFSHGSHEEHEATLRTIRQVSREAGRITGVLQDLGGPKIRTGTIPGDAVDCREGEIFTLVRERAHPDDPKELTCTYPDLPDELKPGEMAFFADGTVAMRVLDSGGGVARMEVTLPGRIRSNQGLNLPGTELKVPALTEKDLRDLDWSATHEVDYVGLSFARRAEDVAFLRRELTARQIDAGIVTKIEKPQAVAKLEAILVETDAVMVARGDLGVEMDVARVPAVQKQIIEACHRARVPVITATQMLASMETSNRPTRAEATDVFNAILDGTDAVMLSGETAIGRYPVEAVSMMSRIAAEAERVLAAPGGWTHPSPTVHVPWLSRITEGIVEATGVVCRFVEAALLVVSTHTGRMALAVSKYRNTTPTLALAESEAVARRMALYWGVLPLHFREAPDLDQALGFAEAWARERQIIRSGDRVVLLRATPAGGGPLHNALLVHEVE